MAVARRPAGGTITPLEFESEVLKNNPLGDPHVRQVPVYLPESYFHAPGRRYPVLYVLAGFTGRGRSLLNAVPWEENLKERLDRMIQRGALVESIAVLPDCFTRFGGSQYLDSSATGLYERHVARELVLYVDRHYRTIPRAGARAAIGKSSGGYGALMLGMKRPDVFGLVACHSGDMYFELCYKPDFPVYLREIRPYRNAAGFLRKFASMPNKNLKRLAPIVNTLAMAASYSPRRGFPPFALPFDETTGEVRHDVWREWLRHDPVHLVDRYWRNLRKLELLYLDCGTEDEYNLHLGARILSGRLKRRRVPHIYEEFPDGHMGVSYRMDRSLALVSRTFRRTAGL